MTKTYKTTNIKEALLLAKKFQKSGKYNLFRGQAQNWEVIPTAGRLSNHIFEQSKEQIERLFVFFNSDKSLKKYRKEVDSIFAIAQHYGIPTNYIDFTENIEVAFYFATNSKSNKIGEESSIICLNEKDFEEFVQFIKILYEEKNVIPPYISRIEVENLWRLQAQKGCFLFTPWDRIEQYYHFDRITFPFTKSFNEIDKEDIYPERKSELEIILDYFFNSEVCMQGQKRVIELAKELNFPIVTIPNYYQYETLEKKETHASWLSESYRKWMHAFNEEWKSSENEKIVNITIPLNTSKEEFTSNVNFELTRDFRYKEIDRKTPLNFNIVITPKLSKKNTKIIKTNCKNIWDGTRNLPYSIHDILTILASYLFLEFQSKLKQDYRDKILLEITNIYGSKTRFEADKRSIGNYFRNDIEDIIGRNIPRPISSELLMHMNEARYVFDFNKLIDFFKTEAIANQVFYNREKEYPVIFYTPNQIYVLGYA